MRSMKLIKIYVKSAILIFTDEESNIQSQYVSQILISSTCDPEEFEKRIECFGTLELFSTASSSRALHAKTEDMYISLPTWCYLD